MKLVVQITGVSPVTTAQEHSAFVAIQKRIYKICRDFKLADPTITVELAKEEGK